MSSPSPAEFLGSPPRLQPARDPVATLSDQGRAPAPARRTTEDFRGNLAHEFAKSRGGIHIHSVLKSLHTILTQVNSPTKTWGALAEPDEPAPAADNLPIIQATTPGNPAPSLARVNGPTR